MATKDIKIIIETLLKSEQFKKQMAAMQQQTKKTTGVMTGFKKVLAGLGVAFSAGMIIRGFRNVIKVGMEFEQSIANVRSVSGGAREELEKLAREAGVNTVFSARQAADAMYFLASAGLDVKDMAKVLTPTLNFAAAAQIDIAKATDMVVGQLKTFRADMSQAEKFTDIMAKTVASANTDMNQLGDALSYAGALAAQNGIQFEDLNAIIATMADQGIKGARAGVQLRMAFTKLIKPTSQAQAVLEKYGITQEQVNNLLDDPIELFKLLKPVMEDAADATTVFGVRQQNIIGIIKNGIPRLEELKTKIENAGGAAQRMADVQLNTLESDLKLLNSAWEEQAIAMTQRITPALRGIVKEVTKLLKPEKDLKIVTNDLIIASREYARITDTLATASDNLTQKEKDKLVVRKAELELKIAEFMQKVNQLYLDQNTLLPTLVRNLDDVKTRRRAIVETLKMEEMQIALWEKRLSEGNLTNQEYAELSLKVENLKKAHIITTQKSLALLVEEKKANKEVADSKDTISSAEIKLAEAFNAGTISRGDLIGVDQELIKNAEELAEKIKLGIDIVEESKEADTDKKETVLKNTGTIINAYKRELAELKKTDDYARQRTALRAKYGAQLIDVVQGYTQQIFDVTGQYFDAAKERQSIRHQEELAALDARYQAELDKAGGLNEQLQILRDQDYAAETKKLEDELAAAIAAGNTEEKERIERELNRRKLEKEKTALIEKQTKERADLEKKQAIESAKLQRSAAIVEKAAALFSIAANTAKGIMGIWAAPPYGPWATPGKIARSAMVGAIGVAQAVAAAAKPLPKIPSHQTGTEETKEGMAYLHEGERVIPRNQNMAGIGNAAYARAAMRGLQAGAGGRYYQNTNTNNQKYITISGITVQTESADNLLAQLEELAENTNTRMLAR